MVYTVLFMFIEQQENLNCSIEAQRGFFFRQPFAVELRNNDLDSLGQNK